MPYLYGYRDENGVWDTLTTTIVNNLSAGSYQFAVQDACGSYEVMEVTITAPDRLQMGRVQRQHPSCVGNNDGAITCGNATGGTPPYTYALNNGPHQISNAFYNLAIGVYDLSVWDAEDCMVSYPNIKLMGRNQLTIKVLFSRGESVVGNNDGYIFAKVKRRSSNNLRYSIDGGLNWQTSGYFRGLANGVYEVMVMESNGCISSVMVTLKSINRGKISLEEAGKQIALKGYGIQPNPINQKVPIIILTKPEKINIHHLEWYASDGRLITQTELPHNTSTEKIDFPINNLDLPKGISYIALYGENKVVLEIVEVAIF